MGCQSCSERRAAASKTQEPYDAKLPDGTVKRVANAAEERVERDKAYQRMREQARKVGYRTGR